MDYYTYAYLREDRTPYYIGKGKGNRAYKRTKTDIKPPKDKSRIIFLKQNLTEEEAFKHERYMIAMFGRIDLGTGILHNKTDGGDGGFNWGTPQQRSEAGRKSKEKFTSEQRSEISKKGHMSRTPEQRSETARKRWEKIPAEQRSEAARKREANKTPEQRSETARRANSYLTIEQRIEAGRKSSSMIWQCTVTGYISNCGGLSSYQKKRGIDTSKRIKLS
jgi:hypothetical protein